MTATTSTEALLSDIPPRPFPTYDEQSYNDFLNNHLIPNTPFLFSPRATADWPARKHWVRASAGPSHASEPNLPELRAYGDQVVPVANTRQREFSEFERDELPLRHVLDLWEKGEGAGLYVKDWHLVAELEARGRGGGDVYAPPPCFRDDWLSPPFDAPTKREAGNTSTADFRFVYAGPTGTFTPLHRDVYGSYSWSANVVGRKVWWLFPPGVERELVDKAGNLLFDLRGLPEERKGVKILQAEGEVIFVPSGWHHQVVNVDFCISVNHNFFASPTLASVYDALCASQRRCEESILDVRKDIRTRLGDARLPDGTPAWEAEWAEEVDGLLARDAGWGWGGFWECVRTNLETPPAAPDLSPRVVERNAFVRDVLGKFKASREYTLLPAVRDIVLQVEQLVNKTP